jgi:hypothetical protein
MRSTIYYKYLQNHQRQPTLVGSPAFGCNKLHRDDEIMAVDGHHVTGAAFVSALRGNNIPGSIVVLNVKNVAGRYFLRPDRPLPLSRS